MASLLFRLSSRVSNGMAEVLVRFTAHGHFSQRAKSHVFCPVSAWSSADGMPAMPHRASASVSAIAEARIKLEQLRDFIFSRWFQEQYDARDGWLQKTIDECFGIDTGRVSKTLREVYEEYAVSRSLDESTKRQYLVLLSALDRWAGKRTLYVDEISVADIDAFCSFFRCERCGGKVINRSQNTITGKLNKWRALQNFAVQRGYSAASPFSRYSIPAEAYGTPVFLTTEERNALYAFADLPPALAVQRDIFIFQCHVGCRVSDLVALKKNNVTDDGFLQYIPQKQRRRIPLTVRVPLSQTAVEIIDRYSASCGDRLLPFVHPNNYNASIHAFMRAAGLDRPVLVQNRFTLQSEPRPLYEVVTSHTARKTFIEAMFRATKSERITSAFTGHADGSRAFSRYTEVDDDMKRDILSRLEK